MHADKIADIELLEDAMGFRPNPVTLDIDLDAAGTVLDMKKGRFAKAAHGNDAPGKGKSLLADLDFGFRNRAEPFMYPLSGMLGLKRIGIRINS